MLISRCSVLAGALLPLVPSANSDDDRLLLLGAQLKVLTRRAVAGRRVGLEGIRWQRWNDAVVQSVALAERVGGMLPRCSSLCSEAPGICSGARLIRPLVVVVSVILALRLLLVG